MICPFGFFFSLAIWENSDEQRHDAKLEITTEFRRAEGESYREVSDRFIFYTKFIDENTSIKFPIKASVNALHEVFKDRLGRLGESTNFSYRLARAKYRVDDWSEEKGRSGKVPDLIALLFCHV